MKRKFLLSTLTLSLAATLTMGAATLSTSATAAEPIVQSAEVLRTDAMTEGAWVDSYGEKGYLIYTSPHGGDGNGNHNAVYSDLYEQNGEKVTDMLVMERNGGSQLNYFNPMKTSSKDPGNSSSIVNASDITLTETSPVSKWGIYSNASWSAGKSEHSTGAKIPGKEYGTYLNAYTNSAGMDKGFAFAFTLKEDSKIQVSAYVADKSSGWTSVSDKPTEMTVAVYKGHSAGTYEESNLLAEVDLTTNYSYVSFAIEGAGDYQIVAYSETKTRVQIAGIFFDEYKEPVAQSAKALGTDATTEGAWVDSYGKKGYLIYTSPHASYNSDTAVYSDLYEQNGATVTDMLVMGREDKSQLNYFNPTKTSSQAPGNSSSIVNADDITLTETSPVSKWGIYSNGNWKAGTSTHSTGVQIPGKDYKTYVDAYTGSAGIDKGSAFAFTLKENSKIQVSAYVADKSSYGTVTNKPTEMTVAVYKGHSAGTYEESNLLAEVDLTTNYSYVSFAIEGAGDYQIVAYSETKTKVQIAGIFFDEYQQTELEQAVETFAEDFNMAQGAAIRIAKGDWGMRFTINANEAKLNALKTVAEAEGATVEVGALLARADSLNGASLTFDNKQAKAVAEKWVDGGKFYATLGHSNLQGNLDVEYTVVGYLKLTYAADNSTKVIYTTYCTNSDGTTAEGNGQVTRSAINVVNACANDFQNAFAGKTDEQKKYAWEVLHEMNPALSETVPGTVA